jgi:heavy metal sensor kinase
VLDSFRVRLTLWYVGVLGVFLVAFSIGVYSLLARSVYQRVDNALQSAVEVTALTLNHEIEEHEGQGPGEKSMGDVMNTMHQTSFPLPSIAVLDGGRLVAGKPGIVGLAPQDLTRLQRPDETSSLGIENRGNTRYRIAFLHAPVPYISHSYWVVGSQSLDSAEQELAGFRHILWICTAVGLLFAAVTGYFLAKRNLAPIVSMSETVQRISSENLDRRLPVANPKDELGRLAGTFNELLERLDRAFAQQRKFIADASHELRTPVSVAMTAAQVNLEGLRAPEDYRDALGIISEQLLRLKRIVHDMFLVARSDSGALQPVLKPLYLDELIDEAVRAARVIAEPRGVRVSRETVPDAMFIGDEGLLRQLLTNLLDNAIRYTGRGGRVIVNCRAEDLFYRIQVSDTGSGIPRADQPFVFNRFYRADKARSRADTVFGGGSGLGLSIAQGIARLHGGDIQLTESSDRGTVFTVILPRPERDGAKAVVRTGEKTQRDLVSGADSIKP